MAENKKVKNATATVDDNIEFKSKLEKTVYNILKNAGYEPQYEPTTYTVWQGYKPTVPFYDKEVVKGRPTGQLKLNEKKIIDIKYTPDFVFLTKNKKRLVFVEAKGIENDVFYIKKKLFRYYLENLDTPAIYFEVYNQRHVRQALEILKQYEDN